MPEKNKSHWEMIKQTFAEWSEDKATRLSAALAFYTMLSIAPLLIIALNIVGSVWGEEATKGQVESYVKDVTGGEGGGFVQEIVKQAGQQGGGTIATIVSIAVLLFSASGVFAELQNSMNTVWEVKPKAGRGIMGMVKDRSFSFLLVLGTIFLLLVSLVISWVLNAISDAVLPGAGWLWWVVNLLVNLAVIAMLFALLFKYVPDVKIAWRSVWIGAIATAVLFIIGKQLLSWYFARGSTTSIYGAFGSLVALLLWVYYSAQILFLGAEFTQVYARSTGERILPTENAVSIRQQDEAIQAKTGATPAGAGEDKQTGGAEPSTGAGTGAGAGERWHPAVPVNYNLAVSPSARAGADGGASTTAKLVPLAIGVAVGKFILGRGKKPPKQPKPQRHLALGRVVEPGWTTRNRHKEEKEITIHVRPPDFVRRAGDRISKGYERAKQKVKEYRR